MKDWTRIFLFCTGVAGAAALFLVVSQPRRSKDAKARDQVPPVADHEERRLPYLPALDGLRALAVMAVILYHSGLGWASGGFLGVEVFFVISGYLITSLLLSEHQKRGSVGLRAFWTRRARRLLPAVFTLIVAMLAYCVIFLPGEVAGLRGDALAAAGYVSNWYLIFDHKSYFETLGRPSLLRHLWSLAVEEQFYLIWPLAFAFVLGRIRPHYALTVILAAAAASAVLMAVQYEPQTDLSRIYYGTDTRAAGLLIGAALAFVWAPGRLPSRVEAVTHRTADTYGFLALGGLVCFFVMITETDRLLYQGGFAALDLLTALLIAAIVHPGGSGIRWLLQRRPLVWIGLRSYSIYLWHWPIFMLTRPQVDVPLGGVALLIVRFAITVALAEASYRFVETPVRRGALGREWDRLRGALRTWRWTVGLRYAGVAAVSLGVFLPIGVSVARSEKSGPPPYLPVESVQTGILAPTPLVAIENGSPAATPERTVPPTTTPPLIVSDSASIGGNSGSEASSIPTVEHVDGGCVMAIGDSVMLGTAPYLTATVTGISIDAAVSRQVSVGIEVLQDWRDSGLLSGANAVVVHLGTNGYFSAGEFDQMMEILSGLRSVVFVNDKVPRQWESANNAVIADGVARYQNAALVDWHSASDNRPDLFWDDGFHPRPEGAHLYATMIAAALTAHASPGCGAPLITTSPPVNPPTTATSPPPPSPSAPPTATPTPAPTASPTLSAISPATGAPTSTPTSPPRPSPPATPTSTHASSS